MNAGAREALKVTAAYRFDGADAPLQLWSSSQQHADRLFRAGTARPCVLCVGPIDFEYASYRIH